MKKNAKLAPPPTSLRQVAIFLHNANFPSLRVTNPPSNSPEERCGFALLIGCERKCVKHFIVKNNLPDNSTCIKVISDLDGSYMWRRFTGGVKC
ncbi:hypothetical protein DXC58_11325 [Ruminococcus sp. TF06-23]|nr:hypothetical protein DWY50_11940 [Ruminococcus sp. AF25-28AC]RHU75541.1 hypothetical protein DXC58_11325 [Ruminococcus sp. TF06-23]